MSARFSSYLACSLARISSPISIHPDARASKRSVKNIDRRTNVATVSRGTFLENCAKCLPRLACSEWTAGPSEHSAPPFLATCMRPCRGKPTRFSDSSAEATWALVAAARAGSPTTSLRCFCLSTLKRAQGRWNMRRFFVFFFFFVPYASFFFFFSPCSSTARAASP